MVGDFGWEHEGPSSRIGTVNKPYENEVTLRGQNIC